MNTGLSLKSDPCSFPRSAFGGGCFAVLLATALVFADMNGHILFRCSVCGFAVALLLCAMKKRRQAMSVFFLCLCVLISTVRSEQVRLDTEHYAYRLVQALNETPHTFEARVTDGNMNAAGNLFVELLSVDGKTLSRPVKAYTYNRSGHFAAEGTRLCFTASLVFPQNRADNAFDLVGWLRGKTVYTTLSGFSDVMPTESTPSAHKRLQSLFMTGIEEALNTIPAKAEYTRTRALLMGLTTGDRSGFTSADKELFSGSGITHILCVSGLHFSLVLGGIGFLASFLIPRRRARLLLLSFLSFLYLLLCGFSVSAVRAAVMALFSGFGFVSDPRRCTEGVLGAAAVMCLVSPATVLDIGFRLSVLSCIGIALFSGLSHVLERRLARFPALCFAAGSLLLSVAAYASTGVYTAFVFGGTALSWILASGLAVLPAQVCLGAGFLAAILVPFFPALAAPFGSAFRLLAEVIFRIAEYFSSLPYTTETTGGQVFGSIWFFFILALGALAVGNKAKGARLCLWMLVTTLLMLVIL